MLASRPACRVNHIRPASGKPHDSRWKQTALVRQSGLGQLRGTARCATFRLQCRLGRLKLFHHSGRIDRFGRLLIELHNLIRISCHEMSCCLGSACSVSPAMNSSVTCRHNFPFSGGPGRRVNSNRMVCPPRGAHATERWAANYPQHRILWEGPKAGDMPSARGEFSPGYWTRSPTRPR